MASVNLEFRKLLKEGIHSAAKRQRVTVAEIRARIGNLLCLSDWGVQYYTKGHIPKMYPHYLETMITFILEQGRVADDWEAEIRAIAESSKQ